MRKLCIAVLTLMMTFFFLPQLHAETTVEVNLFDEVTDWYHSQSNGINYLQSDYTRITYDHMFIEFDTSIPQIDYEIFQPGSRSTVLIYDSNNTLITYKPIIYTSTEETTTMGLTDDLGEYKNYWFRIRIQFTYETTNYDRNNTVWLFREFPETIKPGFRITAYNDIGTTPLTIADLPLTTGTPFNSSQTVLPNMEDYGTVDFYYLNGDITLDITYYGLHSITIESVGFTDDSFLNNVQNVYYYTEDGDHFLYFTYNENDDFILTSSVSGAKTWTGYSIWNLDTNEIISSQRLWALTYIEVEDLDAYAYFYLPTIPTEDLLSVSATYNYRLGKKGPTTFFRQTYTDYETKSIVLEKDVSAVEDVPQWVYDTWTYSASAVAVGGVMSMVPGGQFIGIPLMLAGGVAFNVANVGGLVEIATGAIEDITKINYPSQTLVNNANEHYSTLTGLTIDISGQPIYQLHLGTFSGIDVNYVEFDTSNYKYTEIVFVTEGTTYTITEDYIDNEVIVNEDYVNERPDESEPINIMSMIMMPLVVILFIMIAFRMKAFSSPKQIILLLGLMFLTLYLVGAL